MIKHDREQNRVILPGEEECEFDNNGKHLNVLTSIHASCFKVLADTNVVVTTLYTIVMQVMGVMNYVSIWC